MKSSLLLMLAPVCLALAACSESTHIYTTPPGATVWINGRDLGPAPVKLKVKSWSAHPNAYHYRVEKSGYLPKEGYVQPHLSTSRIVAAALSSCFTCSFHGFYEFDEETEIVLQQEPPAPQALEDPAAIRLRRLQNLYDQGLISADELQEYKTEVLREIVASPAEGEEAAPMPDVIRDLLGPVFNNSGHN